MKRLAWMLVFVAGAAGAASTTEHLSSRLGQSPHQPTTDCAGCHVMDGKVATTPLPVEESCLKCHPDADHHPEDVLPDEAEVPKDWPLREGRVNCISCHAEPSCESGRDPKSPWLRGGTAEHRKDFCLRCHVKEVVDRESPHPETGQPASDDSCSACHHGRPPDGASPAGSQLVAAPRFICKTCHKDESHRGVGEHIGRHLRAPLDPAIAADLPVDADGAIQCWTCHDVHRDPPVPQGARGRLAQAMARSLHGEDVLDYDAMLAQPEPDLCRACHGDGPETVEEGRP